MASREDREYDLRIERMARNAVTSGPDYCGPDEELHTQDEYEAWIDDLCWQALAMEEEREAWSDGCPSKERDCTI